MPLNDPNTIAISPWPEGEDTFHDESSNWFQLREDAQPRLRAAVNVDLDDEGRPFLRPGTTERVEATDALGGFSALGLLLFQDQGTIKRVTSTSPYATANVVTGLSSSARVEFCEHAGSIWWTNGIENGQITSAGAATNWGLAVPSVPTLGTTTGTVPAGRYMVSALCVDANGVEHGASQSAVVTLSNPGAITVDITTVDSDATSCRFFVTRPNGTQLYYAGSAAPGALPVTISDVEVSEEEIRNQFLAPPTPGDGVFSFQGQLITFKDQHLYPSMGAEPHLFEIAKTVETRPSNILAGAGLDTGFWTVCERGAFWTTGNAGPGSWVTRSRDSRRYAKGALVIGGSKIPRLETSQRVALFMSEHGLVAGMPDGSLRMLSEDKHRVTVTDMRASIAYFAGPDFDQILCSMTS